MSITQVQLTTILSWEEVPKVFNVIFGRVMKALKLTEVGRNKYDSKAAVAIPQHKLEVRRIDEKNSICRFEVFRLDGV